jgi:hypothetical protein
MWRDLWEGSKQKMELLVLCSSSVQPPLPPPPPGGAQYGEAVVLESAVIACYESRNRFGSTQLLANVRAGLPVNPCWVASTHISGCRLLCRPVECLCNFASLPFSLRPVGLKLSLLVTEQSNLF